MFKDQDIVVNDQLKKFELELFNQLKIIYNLYRDLLTFIDQVDVHMQDDNVVIDQFDKFIMWENKEESKFFGKISKE